MKPKVHELALPLSAGARRAGWAAALYLFCFIAAVTIIKSASNGLLLGIYPASVLPWLYVATPLVVALALLFLIRPLGRGRVALGSFTAALLVVTLFLTMPLRPRGIVILLYLFGEAGATALSVVFWEQVGTIFDSRTAKRVFGLIGAAGMAGAVVGGLLVKQWAVLFGSRSLLPFAAGCFAVAGLAGIWLSRRLTPGQEDEEEGLGGSTQRPSNLGTWLLGLRLLAANRYPQLIAALIILLSVLSVAVDFLFRSRTQALLPQDDALTSLFGSVNLVVGVVSIVFQLFLTGYLLTRINVRGYLLALLAVIGLAAGLGSLGLAFWPIYVLKVAESATSLSLAQPGIQLLYHPLPPGQRVVLRGLIDGILKKLGIAMGGLLLLVSLPMATRFVSEVGILLLLLPAAALVFLLHSAHHRLLKERVRLTFQGASTQGLKTEELQATLAEALRAGQAHQVRAALELAQAAPGFELAPFLSQLVSHPDPEVRQATIRLAGPGDAPFLHLMSILTAERSLVQAGEVRSLAELLPYQAPGLLQSLLRSPDLQVRFEAIEALYPVEHDGHGPAHALLQRTAIWGRMAAPASERLQLVELIGRLAPYDPAGLAGLLTPYLKDPELTVRRAALETAGRLATPGFLLPLLEALQERAVRQSAMQALAQFGDAAVDACEAWLNDRSRNLEVRLRLPELLRRVGTPRAARALLFSNIEDDPFLRFRIAGALARLHAAHPELEFDRSWTIQAMERRLNSLDYYLPLYADLATVIPPHHLLLRILNDRLLQNLSVLLRLLSLLYPEETLHAIRIRWQLGTRHQRADALNLLESYLPVELRTRILAALEQYDRLRDEQQVYSTGDAPVETDGAVSGPAVQVWHADARRRERRPRPSPSPTSALAALADRGRQALSPASLAVRTPLPVPAAPDLPTPAVLEEDEGPLPFPLEAAREERIVAWLRELSRSRDPLLRAIMHRTLAAGDEALRQAVGPLPPRMENDMAEALMDRVLFLQSVDLFEHQRVDDLVAIAAIVEERSFPEGHVIYREGDPSDMLYIVMEGEVELLLKGKHLLLTRSGESFGQLSMLDRKPRPTTAVARTALRTLCLGRIELFELFADRSELLQGLVEVLVKRIRSLLEEVARAQGGEGDLRTVTPPQ